MRNPARPRPAPGTREWHPRFEQLERRWVLSSTVPDGGQEFTEFIDEATLANTLVALGIGETAAFDSEAASAPQPVAQRSSRVTAGDSNRDFDFNQLDIVQVLQSGKYRSDVPADWAEGDWNGDGVFDQQDLIAALKTASYHEFPRPTTVGDEQTLGRNIQRTMRLLSTSTAEQSNTVRILFYGQSITSQGWWKIVADDLRSRFPYADLVIENRAIGGFGSQLLEKTAETDLYPFYPDLLIFHVYGPAAQYENIIRRVRERTTAEILIQTDHVTEDDQLHEETDPRKLTDEDWDAWRNYSFLPSIAEKYQTGLVDQRELWKQYLTDHGLSASDLLRDGIHLNRHGEYLMAELVKAHFRVNDDDASVTHGQVTTYEVGTDIHLADDQLTLDFSGNRVDVIWDGQEAVEADVRIDGKRPDEFPELYGVTRTTSYPWTGWPTLLDVEYDQPLILEQWRVTITEVQPGGRYFQFDVDGSETGYDGHGYSYARFVSDSGRVVIEPHDWNFDYIYQVLKLPVIEDFEITWQVVPHFVDRMSVPAADSVRHGSITVAQGLPEADHRLVIQGPWIESISAIRVYDPCP